MEKNKNFTVRVSYKVYDYYTIEAKNEQEAIEQALETSATDSLNDFTQDGDGEAIVTQVNNKPVEPKKKKDNEIEVLCIRYEEGSMKDTILAMHERDWKDGRMADKIREALKEIWDDEQLNDMSDYMDHEGDEDTVMAQFENVVNLLAMGISTEFMGDELFFETLPLL